MAVIPSKEKNYKLFLRNLLWAGYAIKINGKFFVCTPKPEIANMLMLLRSETQIASIATTDIIDHIFWFNVRKALNYPNDLDTISNEGWYMAANDPTQFSSFNSFFETVAFCYNDICAIEEEFEELLFDKLNKENEEAAKRKDINKKKILGVYKLRDLYEKNLSEYFNKKLYLKHLSDEGYVDGAGRQDKIINKKQEHYKESLAENLGTLKSNVIETEKRLKDMD
jgi:hypothetical protein